MKYSNSTLILVLLACKLLFAQTSAGDKISVPFSDPDRPGFLEAGLVHGSITIKGYDGKEVIIEAKSRAKRIDKRSRRNSKGMMRLNVVSTGLSVEEQNNRMNISTDSHARTIDLVLQVPLKTSLQLSTVNSGDIYVENIQGELELNNVNGEIKALNISGAVLSNTTNGDVTVIFNKISPDKPMSFVSFNGDVDITFPDLVNADLKLKTEHGEIYTDFEINLEERSKVTKEDSRKEGGKFRLEIESALYGKIGKGGPEYHFSTYNGKIFIRRRK